MFISRNLREQNIAEYLLYMWQVEDLLRAHALDLDSVVAHVVAQYQLDERQRAELTEWYANLIEMMKLEGVEKEGHLQINRNVIVELNDLHVRLIHSTKCPYYQTAYYNVLPAIVEIRSKSHTQHESELENCFDTLYGVWMLKLQHKPLNDDTIKAVADMTTFVGMLNDYYMKDRTGELDLE